MDEPPEEEDPKNAGETELDNRHEKPALEQLSEPGNEETAERCDDVAG